VRSGELGRTRRTARPAPACLPSAIIRSSGSPTPPSGRLLLEQQGVESRRPWHRSRTGRGGGPARVLVEENRSRNESGWVGHPGLPGGDHLIQVAPDAVRTRAEGALEVEVDVDGHRCLRPAQGDAVRGGARRYRSPGGGTTGAGAGRRARPGWCSGPPWRPPPQKGPRRTPRRPSLSSSAAWRRGGGAGVSSLSGPVLTDADSPARDTPITRVRRSPARRPR